MSNNTITTQITEPTILTANTYFWTPATNASSRRRNEERRQQEVADYLTALGFDVTRSGDNVTGTLLTAKGEVYVRFHYSESCKNVYRNLTVTRNGKNSNISTLRKIAAEVTNTPLPNRKISKREGGEDYYKAVAVAEDGRYLSIFDGETAYEIGQEVSQRARQDHNGGIYVYRTIKEARYAVVPDSSKLLDAPRIILRVRAEGQYCVYDNGKLAFSRVTPLEVVG